MSQDQIEKMIAENKALKKEIDQLKKEKDNLTEQMNQMRLDLARYNRWIFGRKSEKIDVVCDGQVSIFDEAENTYDLQVKEPELEETETITYERHKKQKGKRKEDLKALPRKTMLHKLPEEERLCEKCGEIMKAIGKTFIRSEVVYIPAQLYVLDHYMESYECLNCRKTEDKAVIRKAEVPKPLLSHSYTSPSLVAWIMYQKYVNAMPLERQLKDFKAMKFSINKSNMANWMIFTARDYLNPLKNRMLELLKTEPVIHADETPVQVMKEEDRKNTAKSYMWVYTSGYDSKKPIRIFDYRPGRASKYPIEMLEGFTGILQTDAYSGYDPVPGVIRAECWAHLRRSFRDAIPEKESGLQDAVASKGFSYCSALFKLEEEILKLKPEERPVARHDKEERLVNEFFEWAARESLNILPKSKTGKAINYALNHKKEFSNYLDHGHAVLSNNIAENAIRPFTIGRKNWILCGSPKGADASAAIYSITETAKANGLDVFIYIRHLLTELSDKKEDISDHPEILDALMPWNDNIINACREGIKR